MTVTHSALDLSQLPKPNIIEPLDFEKVRTRLLQRFAACCEKEGVDFYDFVESDPAIILLEAAAHEILLDRAQRNDEASSMLLAYAEDADLDHMAAEHNIKRKVHETDAELKHRVQLADERLTSCGTEPAYAFAALEVEGVRDARPFSPAPGQIVVAVLANVLEETPQIVAAVREHLAHEDRRQLTDQLTVQGAGIVSFVIEAELTIYPGPAAAPILETARKRLDAALERLERLDHDVTRSAIIAALHAEGVQNVVLTQPAEDLAIGRDQAAICSNISISEAAERNV